MASKNTVGEIACPFCGGIAEVKKNVKGKFYIWCMDDGIIQPTKPNFQAYIKERAIMYGEPQAGYKGGNPNNNPDNKDKEPEKEQGEAIPTEEPEEEKPTKKSFEDEMGW